MSKADTAAAERYARAIFELGLEGGGDVGEHRRARSSRSRPPTAPTPELRSALENPRVQASERDAVLRAVAERLGFGTLGLNAVRYLARRRRLRALPEIAERLRPPRRRTARRRARHRHAPPARSPRASTNG